MCKKPRLVYAISPTPSMNPAGRYPRNRYTEMAANYGSCCDWTRHATAMQLCCRRAATEVIFALHNTWAASSSISKE